MLYPVSTVFPWNDCISLKRSPPWRSRHRQMTTLISHMSIWIKRYELWFAYQTSEKEAKDWKCHRLRRHRRKEHERVEAQNVEDDEFENVVPDDDRFELFPILDLLIFCNLDLWIFWILDLCIFRILDDTRLFPSRRRGRHGTVGHLRHFDWGRERLLTESVSRADWLNPRARCWAS